MVIDVKLHFVDYIHAQEAAGVITNIADVEFMVIGLVTYSDGNEFWWNALLNWTLVVIEKNHWCSVVGVGVFVGKGSEYLPGNQGDFSACVNLTLDGVTLNVEVNE